MPLNKKPTLKKKEKLDPEGYRNIGALWDNGNFFAGSVMSDPNSDYYEGSLFWWDKKTEKYYQIKSFNVLESKQGPAYNLSIHLENEYHVEEQKED